MSNTHLDGQVARTCPSCDRSIRLNPAHLTTVDPVAEPLCGGCGTKFRADRETGDLLDQ